MVPPPLTVHCVSRYAYFLLVLVSSLGKVLRDAESPPPPLTHRQYTAFPQEPVIAEVFEGIFCTHVQKLQIFYLAVLVASPRLLPSFLSRKSQEKSGNKATVSALPLTYCV